MNFKQKEKAFREEQVEIQQYISENSMFYYDYNDTNKSFFSAGRIGYRRTRCSICNDLINLGECFVHPNWTFLRNNRENDMHIKCFYTTIQKDLDQLENWINFIELNTNDRSFSFKELGN